jgi:MOSC domain-containing protein YiiM
MQPVEEREADGTVGGMGRVAGIACSSGGVPKLAVPEAMVTHRGLVGDRQRNRRFHGGPQRAVCLYAVELIDALRQEGHPIAPGTAGENVTLAGIEWRLLRPGAQLRLGEVTLEVTAFTAPCKTISKSFLDEDFTRISQRLHPGWSRVYARVLREGMLRVGDNAELQGGL